jgi:hypothetical protein
MYGNFSDFQILGKTPFLSLYPTGTIGAYLEPKFQQKPAAFLDPGLIHRCECLKSVVAWL